MPLDTAVYVHALLLAATRSLNHALLALQGKVSDDDFTVYRRATGRILAAFMDDFLTPLYRAHKRLIPPELKNQRF